MPDKEQVYYTHTDVQQITGVSYNTVYRWEKKLEGTHMVIGHHQYHPDFVRLMRTRRDNDGPMPLPDPEKIARLYELWTGPTWDLVEISHALDLPLDDVVEVLDYFGLAEITAVPIDDDL
jgi:hypothetical protein